MSTLFLIFFPREEGFVRDFVGVFHDEVAEVSERAVMALCPIGVFTASLLDESHSLSDFLKPFHSLFTSLYNYSIT